ncbi:MAG: CDP-alcohol phosphatidyltransferase family protein [Candidatus Thermoplasmatota archaeon]|jgi:archaetidylinositol phosphate synthase|nr:CDP-alcohol phosphatidyltransferase family protein [Candidatus Thermoplasmatota archaeon]MCL5955377.1 CDP-alcohol phosphatidyltransferase family protein [Candidatus Thermoplasmatota archaeon]
MVLDSYRGTADKFLIPLSKPFMNINPNTISLFSLIFAGLTGLLFYLGGVLILASFVTLLLSALFDAIDGKVARMRNLSSKRGDLMDHVLDRYSDILIMLGFVFSIHAQMWIGLLAIIGVLLTSYLGVQSQALGLRRNYSGILGRADRLVLMLIFILLQFFIAYHAVLYGILITPINILLIWFAIAGNITAVMRFRDTYSALGPS